jgi:hypothetical protein
MQILFRHYENKEVNYLISNDLLLQIWLDKLQLCNLYCINSLTQCLHSDPYNFISQSLHLQIKLLPLNKN